MGTLGGIRVELRKNLTTHFSNFLAFTLTPFYKNNFLHSHSHSHFSTKIISLCIYIHTYIHTYIYIYVYIYIYLYMYIYIYIYPYLYKVISITLKEHICSIISQYQSFMQIGRASCRERVC